MENKDQCIQERIPKSTGNSAKKKVKVLIGVCSCHKYGEKRRAVRETWLTRVPKDMEALFFVGGGNEVLEDDVIMLPTADDYDGLPKKVQAFFRHSLAHYEFDYLFKCDDDTYLVCDRLNDLLAENDKCEFVGSKDWWPSHADGGAGYLLSRRAVEIAAEGLCPDSGKEDVWITKLLRNSGLELRPSDQLVQNHRLFPGPDNRIVTVHWCHPEIMREIHRAMFAKTNTAVLRLFYARHAAWQGQLKLLQNGIFLGGGGNPNGVWEFQDDERLLVINWFSWPTDTLNKTDFGYANEALKLEILPLR